MVARAAVLYPAADGRALFGITTAQATWLEWNMRRYYLWVQRGRQRDPWASGASGATRYDLPRSKHHKPSGGYGPGQASEPEPEFDLVLIDEVLPTLPVAWRRLYALHWGHPSRKPSRSTLAREVLGCTVTQYDAEWRRARTRLYAKLTGL
jgi:hypothetical protein